MLINASSRVDDVLRQLPQAAHIFISYHTDCIGCAMAKFCTLQDVATHYPLNLQVLIASLQACALPSIPMTKE